jgi:hypothetical protein
MTDAPNPHIKTLCNQLAKVTKERTDAQAKIAELENALSAASGTIAAMRADRLAALPDMIAPLVWEELDEHEYGNTFTAIGKNGRHYEAGVDASGQVYWGFHASVVNDGSLVSGWIADAQDAANTHNRAAIMAPFKP